MGTDIHAYIDYDEDNGENDIHTCNLARVFISRDYWLFTLLSGVRGCSVQGQLPVCEAKGLPINISWQARNDAYLMVLETDDIAEGCCSKRDAERWGNYTDSSKRYVHHPDWHGHSWLTLAEVDEVINRYSVIKERKQIWLQEHEPVPEGYTLKEEEWAGMRTAISNGNPVQVPMELLAIRAMMIECEKTGRNSRFLFWFDN